MGVGDGEPSSHPNVISSRGKCNRSYYDFFVRRVCLLGPCQSNPSAEQRLGWHTLTAINVCCQIFLLSGVLHQFLINWYNIICLSSCLLCIYSIFSSSLIIFIIWILVQLNLASYLSSSLPPHMYCLGNHFIGNDSRSCLEHSRSVLFSSKSSVVSIVFPPGETPRDSTVLWPNSENRKYWQPYLTILSEQKIVDVACIPMPGWKLSYIQLM